MARKFPNMDIRKVSLPKCILDILYPNISGNTLKITQRNIAEKGNGFGFGLFGPDDVARTLSARYFKDGSEILVKQSHCECPRRLTPRECSRLMGFDKSGQSPFKIPVSDTQAYKQFGNAVVVPVAEAVARHMEPHIKSRFDQVSIA